jgi:energy-coupling factor transport system substrate-specific component
MKKQLFKWRLKDIIMVCIIGVLFSLVYMGVLFIAIPIQGALTPFGLATFAFEIFYGIWFMAATLAAYIIQKSGAAFVAELLAAVLEMMMGNMGGALVVNVGLVQGLGSEAGFALFGYRRFDAFSLCVSGALTAIFSFAWAFVVSGYGLLAPGLLAAMLAVRILSAVVFAGICSMLIGKGLAKTGVLKSYALGRTFVEAEIMDEND